MINRMICTLIGSFDTVRYLFDRELGGHIILGHDLEYTGEMHSDHWEMRCKRCGATFGTDTGPDAETDESTNTL